MRGRRDTTCAEHDLDTDPSAEYEIIGANPGIAPAHGKRLISSHFSPFMFMYFPSR